MTHRRRAAAHAATLAFAVVAACGAGDEEPATVERAEAVAAIIRWQVAANPPVPGSDGSGDLPVIYVASAHGDSIGAGIQADVVDATKDDAVVRFADSREDVVDMDDKAEPVQDDDVMLLLGPVPEPARSIEVEVVRYRSLDDQTTFVLSLTPTRDGARVTAAREPRT